MDQQINNPLLSVHVIVAWFKEFITQLRSKTPNEIINGSNQDQEEQSNDPTTNPNEVTKPTIKSIHFEARTAKDLASSNANSVANLERFLAALPEQRINDFGSHEFTCEAVFLFEDDWLEERVTGMASITGKIGQLTILNSKVAKENDHDSIYNTVVHKFKIDDNRLMILPSGKQDVPFIIWLNMKTSEIA